jgi:hypothetical protein
MLPALVIHVPIRGKWKRWDATSWIRTNWAGTRYKSLRPEDRLNVKYTQGSSIVEATRMRNFLRGSRVMRIAAGTREYVKLYGPVCLTIRSATRINAETARLVARGDGDFSAGIT